MYTDTAFQSVERQSVKIKFETVGGNMPPTKGGENKRAQQALQQNTA
jgi:hypothetical protein